MYRTSPTLTVFGFLLFTRTRDAVVGGKTKSHTNNLVVRPSVQGIDTFINHSWKLLWKARIHPRHKILWWRIIQDALPIRDRLTKAFQIETVFCPMCDGQDEVEMVLHIFLRCPLVAQLWFNGPWGLQTENLTFDSQQSWAWIVLNGDILPRRTTILTHSFLFSSLQVEHAWRE